MKIQPVILCGGSGTRLWPISRAQYPKQFMSLPNGSSLFKETILRARDIEGSKCPIIVSNDAYRFYVSSSLVEENIDGAIILEPASRSTAPAIALAAFSAFLEEDALLLVMPSDHSFQNSKAFCDAINYARMVAESGKLVTFGITPTYPETGYGYIKKGDELQNNVFKVNCFLEKPSLECAERMLSEGGYYWNSGIFLFKASTYLEELKKYAPSIFHATSIAWRERHKDLEFIRPSDVFYDSPTDSIDYAVMEKTSEAVIVPIDCNWNDLGSWKAFYDTSPKDMNGNALEGDVITENSSNCYFYSTGRLIAAVDVKDLTVIETRDAILVANLQSAQNVKRIVEKLKLIKRPEFESHLKSFRPWGNYETLVKSDRFQVKRIVVKPGEQTSLQKHYHRSEHWIVVSGTAKVTLKNKIHLITENESIYIPLGDAHRITNPGTIPLVLIEVQSGAYLGEDDIVRLEDNYGRTES